MSEPQLSPEMLSQWLCNEQETNQKLRKLLAAKEAEVERLRRVCQWLVEIDDGLFQEPALAIEELAKSCRAMRGNEAKP